MTMHLTLTSLQSEFAESIVALGENGPRAMGYRMTFLNRKGRGLSALHRQYIRAAMQLGFDSAQADTQWQDVKDYAQLLSISAE
jgi:hypothetical protein